MRVSIVLVVITFFAILFLNFSSPVLAEGDISPASSFYFLRTFWENIQAKFIFSSEQQFHWHYALAQQKIKDTENLISLGKLNLVQVILEEYKGQYEFLKQASAQNPDFKSQLVNLAGLQTAKLISLFDLATDAKDKRAINSSILFLTQFTKLPLTCDFLKQQSQNTFWNGVERAILAEKYEKTCANRR